MAAPQCSVCADAAVLVIDAELRGGAPIRQVALRHGLDYSAMKRHRANGHVTGVIDPAPLPAGRAGPAPANARAMLVELIDQLEARDTVDANGVSTLSPSQYVALVKEKRQAFADLARIEGPSGPPVFDPVASAEWVELRETIFRTLEPYPEALGAVLEAVRGLGAV